MKTNKSISKILIHMILFLAIVNGVKGQTSDKNPVSISSPNAMSLGVFGEFPAAMPTGVPAINIPIYNLQYKGINVPIALNYNTNLVKPDVHPGWVGLGWGLAPGGMISRAVNGKPDDAKIFNYYNYEKLGEDNVGYYYNYSKFDSESWESEESITDAAKDITNYEDFGLYFPDQPYLFDVSILDYQPDEFFFSFLGISGTFYLSEKGEWKVRSDQNIKVIFNESDLVNYADNPLQPQERHFGKFTLVDDKGIKYVFGGYDNAIEFSADFLSTNSYLYHAKTWYLTQVVLPVGDKIDFNYERGWGNEVPQLYYYHGLGTDSKLRFTGSVVIPSYLTSIETENQSIEFNRSVVDDLKINQDLFSYETHLWYGKKSINDDAGFPLPSLPTYNPHFQDSYRLIWPNASSNHDFTGEKDWAKLNSIVVKSKFNNEVIKNIEFSYVDIPTQRLRLESITEIGTKKNYEFEYRPGILPEYFSMETDHWGFYNGKTIDFTTKETFLNSKEPDETALQTELLSKVIYPTKGYAQYEFQGHNYSIEVDDLRYNPLIYHTENKLAGGVRVKKVSNFDSNDSITNSVSYFYEQDYPLQIDGMSSGVLGGKSEYIYSKPSTLPASATLYSRLPLSHNSNGSHIGYSKVTQVFADGGYSVNEFSNFDNGENGEYMDQPLTVLFGDHFYTNIKAYTSKAFERGNLLTSSVYSNSDKKLSENKISYKRINEEGNYVRGYLTYWSGLNAENQVSGATLKIPTYAYLMKETENKTYSQSSEDAVSTVSTFEYDPVHLRLKKNIVEIGSENKNIATHYSYPEDYADEDGFIKDLKNANITGVPIEQVVYQTELNGNNPEILSGQVTTFKPGKRNMGLVDKVYSLETSEPIALSSFKFANKLNGVLPPGGTNEDFEFDSRNYDQKQTFEAYDNKGNLLSLSSESGEKASYLWGYKQAFPIAKIQNAALIKESVPNSSGEFGNATNVDVSYLSLGSFTIEEAQDISLDIDFFFSGTSFGETNFTCYLASSGQSGGSPVYISSEEAETSEQVIYLEPDTYTVKVSVTMDQADDCEFDMSATYYQGAYWEKYNILFENFEEHTSGVVAEGNTGKQSSNVGYSKTVDNLETGLYKLEYWEKVGGDWERQVSEIDVSTGTYDVNITGQVDDVRFYPKGALMTTYTYEPLVGMTSQTDPNGRTVYYEYDSFGRLKLTRKDDQSIVQKLDYHYKGEGSE